MGWLGGVGLGGVGLAGVGLVGVGLGLIRGGRGVGRDWGGVRRAQDGLGGFRALIRGFTEER